MNSAAYTETVVSNFLRYQMTAYPFADPDLYAQSREEGGGEVLKGTVPLRVGMRYNRPAPQF